MVPLIARANWPDSFDTTTIVVFVAVAISLPAFGYFFAVIDFRAYLRTLRRALVRVVHYFPDMPGWARCETPPCLRAMGLRAPCTEEDVKRVYRCLAEQLHPDRGGDKRRFLLLQEQFEKALHYVRELQPSSPTIQAR